MSGGLTTLVGLPDPSRQKHHIPGNRGDVDVVRLVAAFDLVEISAPRIRLRRLARHEQLPKVFDGVRCVFARIFDACPFFKLNLHTTVPSAASCWTIGSKAGLAVMDIR